MSSQAVARRPQQYQRERNLKLVMNALREGGPASRSKLAAVLHLDRSTLTHLSNALLGAGLVVESSELSASTRGGRRPRPLALNPAGYAAAGVDIRSDDAEWTLVRLDGSSRGGGLIERARDLDSLSWLRTAFSAVADNLASLERQEALRLLGVGVSVTGAVDPRTGYLARSVALGVESVSIPDLWNGSGLTVTVDNDANCCAWNLTDDQGLRKDTIVCQIKMHRDRDGNFLPSGAGVGLAFLLNGNLHYGKQSAAGELHGAGRNGTWPDQFGLRLDRIQAEQGTNEALGALARAVLKNLSVVTSAIDPDHVVLTGDVDELSPMIPDLLSEELVGSSICRLSAQGALTVMPAAELPASLGAARLVLSRLFRLNSAESANPHGGAEWQAIIEGSASPTLTPGS